MTRRAWRTLLLPATVACLFAAFQACSKRTTAPVVTGPAPAGVINVTTLDFDSVRVDSEAIRSFSVSNVGGGVLRGAVRSLGPGFVVLDSTGYALAHGESVPIRVAFRPRETGAAVCSLTAGGVSTSASGRGVGTSLGPPDCFGFPAQLDFGDQIVGSSTQRTLEIRSTRSHDSSVRLNATPAPDYTVQPAGAITVPANGSLSVTVTFAPTVDGPHPLRLDIGSCLTCSPGCGSVAVSGNGTLGGVVITRDTVLTLADSPHAFNTDLTVANGATLTVAPGVELRFGPGAHLFVGTASTAGTLVADGTSGAPIRITGTSATPGSWEGIEFRSTAVGATLNPQGDPVAGSFFRHCVIEYATGVLAQNGPAFDCTTLRACRGLGDPFNRAVLRAVGPAGTKTSVKGCAIQDNSGGGVWLDQDLDLIGSVIQNNGATGVTVNHHPLLTSRDSEISGNAGFTYINVTAAGGIQVNDGGRIDLASTTVANNSGNGIFCDVPGPVQIANCNLTSNTPYNLVWSMTGGPTIPSNWWGTTDSTVIDATIRCTQVPTGTGCAQFTPVLTAPARVTPLSCAPVQRR